VDHDHNSNTDDELSQRLIEERNAHIHNNNLDDKDTSIRGIETSEQQWGNSTAAAQLYGEFAAPKRDGPLVLEQK